MDEEGWSMPGVWNEMHTQGVFVMGPQHRSVLVSKLVSGVEGDGKQGREGTENTAAYSGRKMSARSQERHVVSRENHCT